VKYFELSAKDALDSSWILFRQPPPEGLVEVRARYADLACPECRKMDERAAVARGLEPDVRLQARGDWVTTDEGFTCCSARARQTLDEAGVAGLRYIPLPADARYLLVVPEEVVRVDLEAWKQCFEYGRPCPRCGRPSEMTGQPTLECFSPPDDALVAFGTDLLQECGWAGAMSIYVSEFVRDILERNRLTGTAHFWELATTTSGTIYWAGMPRSLRR